MDKKQVGILIFEEVEVLDFCGPFEVFSVTRLKGCVLEVSEWIRLSGNQIEGYQESGDQEKEDWDFCPDVLIS